MIMTVSPAPPWEEARSELPAMRPESRHRDMDDLGQPVYEAVLEVRAEVRRGRDRVVREVRARDHGVHQEEGEAQVKKKPRKIRPVRAWGVVYPSGVMSPCTAGTKAEAFTQTPPGWRVVRVEIRVIE